MADVMSDDRPRVDTADSFRGVLRRKQGDLSESCPQ